MKRETIATIMGGVADSSAAMDAAAQMRKVLSRAPLAWQDWFRIGRSSESPCLLAWEGTSIPYFTSDSAGWADCAKAFVWL